MKTKRSNNNNPIELKRSTVSVTFPNFDETASINIPLSINISEYDKSIHPVNSLFFRLIIEFDKPQDAIFCISSYDEEDKQVSNDNFELKDTQTYDELFAIDPGIEVRNLILTGNNVDSFGAMNKCEVSLTYILIAVLG